VPAVEGPTSISTAIPPPRSAERTRNASVWPLREMKTPTLTGATAPTLVIP
jgi:hypothetical protein